MCTQTGQVRSPPRPTERVWCSRLERIRVLRPQTFPRPWPNRSQFQQSRTRTWGRGGGQRDGDNDGVDQQCLDQRCQTHTRSEGRRLCWLHSALLPCGKLGGLGIVWLALLRIGRSVKQLKVVESSGSGLLYDSRNPMGENGPVAEVSSGVGSPRLDEAGSLRLDLGLSRDAARRLSFRRRMGFPGTGRRGTIGKGLEALPLSGE